MIKKTPTPRRTQLNNVDTHIKLNSPLWSFSLDGLAGHFSDHIKKSIPSYKYTQNLILDLSDYYVRRGGVCYDLGCSVGELTQKLAEKHKENKDISWVGLDKESQMIDYAKKNSSKLDQLDFIHCDFLDYPFQKSNFVMICYTLQFMSQALRLDLLQKVYEALEEGGACIICEKVLEESPSAQSILESLYKKHKITEGFSSQEILAKEASLRGVLTPLTRKQNFKLFEKAGFENFTLLAKNLHFETYLLEKS